MFNKIEIHYKTTKKSGVAKNNIAKSWVVKSFSTFVCVEKSNKIDKDISTILQIYYISSPQLTILIIVEKEWCGKK